MTNQIIKASNGFNPLMSEVPRNRNGMYRNGHDSDTIAHADTQDNQVMLTTIDNPFDPFTQFDSWFAFDEGKNYNSCSYLARIAKTSDELSEADNELAIRQAIDEIVQLNVLGIYKKVIKT